MKNWTRKSQEGSPEDFSKSSRAKGQKERLQRRKCTCCQHFLIRCKPHSVPLIPGWCLPPPPSLLQRGYPWWAVSSLSGLLLHLLLSQPVIFTSPHLHLPTPLTPSFPPLSYSAHRTQSPSPQAVSKVPATSPPPSHTGLQSPLGGEKAAKD